jgi:hypothetical protein
MDPLTANFPLKEIRGTTKMALSEEEGQVIFFLIRIVILHPQIGRALFSLDRVVEAEELLLRIKQSLFRYFSSTVDLLEIQRRSVKTQIREI